MPAKELNKVACLLIKGGEICYGPAKKSDLINKGWPLRATPYKTPRHASDDIDD